MTGLAEEHSVVRLPERLLYSETCRWSTEESNGRNGLRIQLVDATH